MNSGPSCGWGHSDYEYGIGSWVWINFTWAKNSLVASPWKTTSTSTSSWEVLKCVANSSCRTFSLAILKKGQWPDKPFAALHDWRHFWIEYVSFWYQYYRPYTLAGETKIFIAVSIKFPHWDRSKRQSDHSDNVHIWSLTRTKDRKTTCFQYLLSYPCPG